MAHKPRAEQDALKKLWADTSILILPADKEGFAVAMDKTDYIQKANSLLDDRQAYLRCDDEPMRKLLTQMDKTLAELQTNNVPEKAPVGQEIRRKSTARTLSLHWRIIAALLYSVYTWFPLNTTSRIVGQMARVRLPRFLRGPACRIYAWIFSARLDEAEFYDDLGQYSSMSQFFRRRLLPSVRPVDTNACLTSPADGKVMSCGRVEEGHLEQVKGLAYTLRALLGPNTWSASSSSGASFFSRPSSAYRDSKAQCCQPEARVFTVPCNLDQMDFERSLHCQRSSLCPLPSPFPRRSSTEIPTEPDRKLSLYHCTIYLAPGDYHCFHSPTDWSVHMRRHFPGRLFSVCSLVTSWLSGVFCINERAVYMGHWKYGFFAYVAVGATNVGSIRVFEDPHLVTNRPNYLRCLFSSRQQVQVDPNCSATDVELTSSQVPIIRKMDGYEDLHFPSKLQLKKGDLFGEFNFGSTIVLIFEAPSEGFEFVVKSGDRVQVGRPLGNVHRG
nr:unnamed protein product [Spirometra erinaceieuropaei]